MTALEKFLGDYTSTATVKSYRSAITRFLRSVYREGDAAALADRYIQEFPQRDFLEDMKTAMKGAGTGKTANLVKAATLEFLRGNGIFPKGETLHHLKRCARKLGILNRPATVDADLSLEDLKKIVELAGVRERAIILIAASSGARASEVLGLHLRDLHLDKVPAEIVIREAKDGSDRVSFISQEAMAAIKAYLAVRSDYLSLSEARNGKVDPRLLFPVGYPRLLAVFTRLVEKAGLAQEDRRTGRRTVHFHSLRKFNLSALKADGMPEIIAEGLAGHTGGYLSEAYARVPVQTQAQEYLKHEGAVSIYRSVGTEKLEMRVQRQEQQIGDMARELRELQDLVGSPSAGDGEG